MAKFTPAKFDAARFDYAYFDVTDPSFGSVLATENAFIDKVGELVTLITYSETTDSVGGVTAVTETTDTDVRVVFKDESRSRRDVEGRGVIEEGSANLVTKRSYDLTNNGDGYILKVGDTITRTQRNDELWRVEEHVRTNTVGGGSISQHYRVKKVDT